MLYRNPILKLFALSVIISNCSICKSQISIGLNDTLKYSRIKYKIKDGQVIKSDTSKSKISAYKKKGLIYWHTNPYELIEIPGDLGHFKKSKIGPIFKVKKRRNTCIYKTVGRHKKIISKFPTSRNMIINKLPFFHEHYNPGEAEMFYLVDSVLLVKGVSIQCYYCSSMSFMFTKLSEGVVYQTNYFFDKTTCLPVLVYYKNYHAGYTVNDELVWELLSKVELVLE